MQKSLLLLILICAQSIFANSFIKIQDKKFIKDGKSYEFIGANFWQAIHLAHLDRNLLSHELDTLKSIGVNQIRVMALSEGPDSEPYRVTPAFQTEPGVFNEKLLIALDFLMVELAARDMNAVLVLGNFWPWSGGFAQWVSWFENSSIPYPPPHPFGSWSVYQRYATRFYKNEKIQIAWRNSIKQIISRKNSISNINYIDDPAILSWELANEPRGGSEREEFLKWIKDSSDYVRSLDQNHMITLGSEGNTINANSAGNDFFEDHNFENIDYMTFHLWVENWGIYNPFNAIQTLPISINYMKDYVNEHVEIAQKLNKPIVLEEFGISRDKKSMDPKSLTQIRDQYFEETFALSYDLMKADKLNGVNFWAWSGSQLPNRPYGYIWKPNDPLLGDPPHEEQGWYGVYSSDLSTLNIIKKFTSFVN